MNCAKNQENDLVNKMLSMDLGLMLNDGKNADLNFQAQNVRTSLDKKMSSKVEMVSHWLQQAKQSQEEGQLGLEGLRRMDQNGAEGLERVNRMQQNGRLEDQMRLEGHLLSEHWTGGSFPSILPSSFPSSLATSFPSRAPSSTVSFRSRHGIATQQMVDYKERLPLQNQQQSQALPMSTSLPEHYGFNVYVHQTDQNPYQFLGNPLNSINREDHPAHRGSQPIHEENNPMYNARLGSRNYTSGMDSIYDWTTLGSNFHPQSEASPPSLGAGFQPFSTPMGRTPSILEEPRPRSSSLGGAMRPTLVGQPGGPRGNPRRYNGQRLGAGKRFCNFCKTNGERMEVYQSHNTGPPGSVTCPNLFKHQCEVCGSTGRNAHTRAYCPRRENNDRPLVLALKSTLRKSDGRLRKESCNW